MCSADVCAFVFRIQCHWSYDTWLLSCRVRQFFILFFVCLFFVSLENIVYIGFLFVFFVCALNIFFVSLQFIIYALHNLSI